MLTASGRRLRTVVTVVVFGLLLLGTLAGQDDAFPFGPFRMYATTSSPDGSISSLRLEATDATGKSFRVEDGRTGMRRAELEGELWRFEADPGLMLLLAEGHRRLNPGSPRLVALQLVVEEIEMRGGRPTGRRNARVVASWPTR